MLYEWYIFLSSPLRLLLAVVNFLKRAKREKEFSHVTILWPLSFWLSSLGITVWRIHEWLLAGLSRGYPSHTVDAPWFRDCETACHLLGAVARCVLLYSPRIPSTEGIATDIGIGWALATLPESLISPERRGMSKLLLQLLTSRVTGTLRFRKSVILFQVILGLYEVKLLLKMIKYLDC